MNRYDNIIEYTSCFYRPSPIGTTFGASTPLGPTLGHPNTLGHAHVAMLHGGTGGA